MQKIIWLSDLHLESASEEAKHKFFDSIGEIKPGSVLSTGDVGNFNNFSGWLIQLAKLDPEMPVIFVSGNHEPYNGSIAGVKRLSYDIDSRNLFYLSNRNEPFKLGDGICVIGIDSWYDYSCGNRKTLQTLNDFYYIEELVQARKERNLIGYLNSITDKCVVDLRFRILKAYQKDYKKVIILSHVPLFRDSCLYEGKISGEDYLPLFCSTKIGDSLIENIGKINKENYKEMKFLILSGHTHFKSSYKPLPNLLSLTAEAQYSKPVIQASFDESIFNF